MGHERIVDKDNKKRMINDDDHSDRGLRAKCPKCNPADVRRPCEEHADL